MEYNFEEAKNKFAKLAPILGEGASGLSVDDAAKRSIRAVRKLTRRLNRMGAIPVRLREVGIREEDLTAIAEASALDGTAFYNPREVIPEQILVHLKKAF
jgi:alcohol dehydrogenase class IV